MRERLQILMSYQLSGINHQKDITDDIIGLENVAFSAQRDWFTGIISEIKIDMNVRRGANTKDLAQLYEDWLNGEMQETLTTIEVILYGGTRGSVKPVKKLFYVNFNTFKTYKHKYSFNLETPNILSWINSKGTHEAKIKVAKVGGLLSMDYAPMVLPCKAYWEGAKNVIQENKELTGNTNFEIVVLQLDFSKIEGVPEGQSILFCRQQMSNIYEAAWDGGSSTPHFNADTPNCAFLSVSDNYPHAVDVHLDIDFTIAFFLQSKDKDVKHFLKIARFNGGREVGDTIFETIPSQAGGNSISEYLDRDTREYNTFTKIKVEVNKDISLKRGEQLVMYIGVDAPNNWAIEFKGNVLVCYEEFNKFEASWTQASTTINGGITLPIDTVGIDDLFNATLEDLGAPEDYKVEIEWDEPFNNIPRLIAAESANRTADVAENEPPFFHSKINDIMQCLQTMGYEYTVSEDQKKLIFKRRHKIFSEANLEILPQSRVRNEYTYHDADNTYTRLKIGYQKSDIDNPVGKYDPVGVTIHETGIILSQAKECELVSPIRADVFGIEQLTWKQWKRGVDREDNDIFLVDCVKSGTGKLKLWDKIHIAYIVDNKPIKFYNALRTPLANIVLNNADLLFSFCDEYGYKSGNVYENNNVKAYYKLVENATFPDPSEGKRWLRLKDNFALADAKNREQGLYIRPLFRRQLMKLSVGTLEMIDVNSPLLLPRNEKGIRDVGFVKKYDYKILTNGGGELDVYLAR